MSDEVKAVLFANHLAHIFQPHTDMNSKPDQLESMFNFLIGSLPIALPIKPITPVGINLQIN